MWISRYAAGGNIFLDLEVGRGADRRPEQGARPAWSTCCRSRSAPTGRCGSTAARASCARTDAAPDGAAVRRHREGGPARGRRRRRQPLRRRPHRRQRRSSSSAAAAAPSSSTPSWPASATWSAWPPRSPRRLPGDAWLSRRARAGRPGSRRSVRSWYSAYGAYCATQRSHHSSRSAPSAMRATYACGSGPSWRSTSRVGDEVVVPGRVLGGAALRRDGGVDAVMLDPHHRVLAELAGLVAARGDHHDRPLRVAAEDVRLGAAGRLVLLDLVADPLGRAGLVLTLKCHIHPEPEWRPRIPRRLSARRGSG